MFLLRVFLLISIVVSVYEVDNPEDYEEDVKKGLEFYFEKADINADGVLDSEEIVQWINDADQELKDEIMSATWNEIKDDDSFFHVKKTTVLNHVCNGSEECIEKLQNRMSTMNVEDEEGITKEQLEELLYPQFSEDKETRLKPLTEYVQGLDNDGDGEISYNEYFSAQVLPVTPAVAQNTREEYFHKHLDKNRNGKLCKSEILNWLSPDSDSCAKEIITKADTNNDNFLSKDEIFANYLDFLLLVPRSYFEERSQDQLRDKKQQQESKFFSWLRNILY